MKPTHGQAKTNSSSFDQLLKQAKSPLYVNRAKYSKLQAPLTIIGDLFYVARLRNSRLGFEAIVTCLSYSGIYLKKGESEFDGKSNIQEGENFADFSEKDSLIASKGLGTEQKSSGSGGLNIMKFRRERDDMLQSGIEEGPYMGDSLILSSKEEDSPSVENYNGLPYPESVVSERVSSGLAALEFSNCPEKNQGISRREQPSIRSSLIQVKQRLKASSREVICMKSTLEKTTKSVTGLHRQGTQKSLNQGSMAGREGLVIFSFIIRLVLKKSLKTSFFAIKQTSQNAKSDEKVGAFFSNLYRKKKKQTMLKTFQIHLKEFQIKKAALSKLKQRQSLKLQRCVNILLRKLLFLDRSMRSFSSMKLSMTKGSMASSPALLKDFRQETDLFFQNLEAEYDRNASVSNTSKSHISKQ